MGLYLLNSRVYATIRLAQLPQIKAGEEEGTRPTKGATVVQLREAIWIKWGQARVRCHHDLRMVLLPQAPLCLKPAQIIVNLVSPPLPLEVGRITDSYSRSYQGRHIISWATISAYAHPIDL